MILAAIGAAGCAKRYRVDGIVLQTDSAARRMTVSHRPVDGFMPAMTMLFAVRDAREITGLLPGARVQFDLRVSKQASWAERVRVYQPPPDPDTPAIAWPKPRDPVAIGAALPGFTLIAEDGSVVSLASLRGKTLAVDFIYTRCPLPDVCPRLSAIFAYLQRQFGDDVVLLSITVDPEYDQPSVLAEYARRWRADTRRWRFLTGPPEEIARVAGHFGLVYWPEEQAVVHSVAIAVVDAQGRLVAKLEGSSHRPDQVRDLIAAVRTQGESTRR
jgi:protein SCO1/2